LLFLEIEPVLLSGGDWQSAAYEAISSPTTRHCLSTWHTATWTSRLWEDAVGKCNSWCMCF